MKLNADVVIVGSGVAGLFSALNLSEEQENHTNYQIRSGKQ